jgi:ABC-type multidrug transport system ATPase subunit
VDGLSFRVSSGHIFGLLGPNGAGKTTTLRILTTLIRPTSGHARVAGCDVVRDPLGVRRRITVVVQENAAELFLNVRDNLMTFARFHGLWGMPMRARVNEVIEQFGLTAEASRKAMDLSGGYRRRLQVAKVFVVDTPIVFLDEFSTGMDPILKRSVMTMMRKEAARGRTIVLTTHILSEAEELCDDILIVKHGREIARGDVPTLKQLSTNGTTLEHVFLELMEQPGERVGSERPFGGTQGRPELVEGRGAKTPSESERGWGPASAERTDA